ncbi:MAG: hypothetical protein K8Q92_02990, partial [Methylophilales bacterium]|nr:hypothetical protein [Methylophilales bacterium]
MSRVNPVRPQQTIPSGLKRVVLQNNVKPEEVHAPKPIRSPVKPETRVLVIAHSDRGALDDHARQALAAAAILADTDTTVVALVLGELHDDLSDAGADEVMVLPELDFHKFQPDVELASLLAVIKSTQPTRIFMPDNLIGDGDLGRRLIAHSQLTAAAQVVEIDAKHVASYQVGCSVLAIRNLPKIVLLAANAVDTDLPFCANAKRLDAIELND